MPAFGSPTRPASASSFSRSSIQPDSPSSPRSAKRGAWRVELVKRLLPCPPAPPGGDDRPLARLDEVVAAALEALDLRAGRHRDDRVVAAGAVALVALAVAAAPGALVGREAQRGEVAARGVADEDDVAAAAAVAAVGPAARARAPRGGTRRTPLPPAPPSTWIFARSWSIE